MSKGPERYSAGVLPWTVRDGVLYFLLGKEERDRQSWADFGGHAEAALDGGNFLHTASREFWEESLGVVCQLKALRNRLVPGGAWQVVRGTTQAGHPYHMVLLAVPYSPHYRGAFRRALDFLKQKSLFSRLCEKTDVRWCSLDAMLSGKLVLRPVFERTFMANLEAIRGLGTGCV